MDVRVTQPSLLMRSQGVRLQLHEGKITAPRNYPADEPKILVVHRFLPQSGPWLNAVRQIIQRGWLIVSEIDDYPADTGVSTNAGKWAKSMGWRGYACCHAVQTSTEPLAEFLREHNPEVRVFENQLFARPNYVPRTDENVRVFFGAVNRHEDWAPIMPVLNEVLAQHPEIEMRVIHDKAFFDALNTENKTFTQISDYDTYLTAMAACDIALLPLRNEVFTHCKSDIKFVEAAGAGLAVIASPTVYGATVKPGETGLIADTAEQWRSALTSLVTDKAKRQQIAAEAVSYVLGERMLAQHIQKRIDWYQSLWDRRHQLNAALLQRFPKLKG